MCECVRSLSVRIAGCRSALWFRFLLIVILIRNDLMSLSSPVQNLAIHLILSVVGFCFLPVLLFFFLARSSCIAVSVIWMFLSRVYLLLAPISHVWVADGRYASSQRVLLCKQCVCVQRAHLNRTRWDKNAYALIVGNVDAKIVVFFVGVFSLVFCVCSFVRVLCLSCFDLCAPAQTLCAQAHPMCVVHVEIEVRCPCVYLLTNSSPHTQADKRTCHMIATS